MRAIHRYPALLLVLGTLSGCNTLDSCTEFAAPPGRQATKCPEKPVTDKPYAPAKYCYQSLGQVDCYAEPQPGRPGYLGSGS
jgi:hypothetical protein